MGSRLGIWRRCKGIHSHDDAAAKTRSGMGRKRQMLELMLLRVKAAFKFWISYADMVLLLNAVLQQQRV